MTGSDHDADIELESQEFRESLLGQLNGQSESMQRLIKLTDTRFQSMARRIREHRQEHSEDSAETRRWLLGGLAVVVAVIGTTEAIVALIERFV